MIIIMYIVCNKSSVTDLDQDSMKMIRSSAYSIICTCVPKCFFSCNTFLVVMSNLRISQRYSISEGDAMHGSFHIFTHANIII